MALLTQGVLDVTIGLESAQDYVEEPEKQEEHWTYPLGRLGASELRLTEHGEEPPGQDGGHGGDGADAVDHHAEGQGPGGDLEPTLWTLKKCFKYIRTCQLNSRQG